MSLKNLYFATKEYVDSQLTEGVDNPVDVMEDFTLLMDIVENAVYVRDWSTLIKVVKHWNGIAV